MVYHIVLFRARPDLSRTEREAFAASLQTALQTIPSIRGFHIGRRLRTGAAYDEAMQDMEYIGLLEFDDVTGLRAYLEHPAHAELGERFYASVAGAYVYDYDVRGPEGIGVLLEGA